jgi:hypothetical protein
MPEEPFDYAGRYASLPINKQGADRILKRITCTPSSWDRDKVSFGLILSVF